MRRVLVALILVFTPSLASAQITVSNWQQFTSGFTTTGPILFPNGTAAAPSIAFASDADGTGTGLYRFGTNSVGFSSNGVGSFFYNSAQFQAASAGWFCWSGTTIGAASDACLRRLSAGVITHHAGTGTSIGALLGGGAAVASAAAMPAPTGNVFHVTGTTNITSITSTNFISGACFTIIFDDVLTFTDGNNLVLAGNFTTTANDTISLCYDGTNFYETARSVN